MAGNLQPKIPFDGAEEEKLMPTQKSFLYPVLKRSFDLLFSLALLFLLSPLLTLVAALILLVNGKPIFFTQERPGLHGRLFTLRKFRTMSGRCDKRGLPLTDEERLTRLGRVLRATSLDELPELLNVLRGEMSFVGPRPLLVEYLPLYSAEQKRRHEVKPGLTGWAQVNGRNSVSWEERFALDTWYVDNRSFALDLKIIILTVGKVLTREGISAKNHATMPKFSGPRRS